MSDRVSHDALSPCPHCERPLDWSTAMNRRPLRAGDIFVCSKCGEISMVAALNVAVKMNLKSLAEAWILRPGSIRRALELRDEIRGR